MSEDSSGGLFRQVIVVALDGFGAGAQPDAADYRDRGANTLRNVSTYIGGLDLAILQWLGLGNVTPVRGVAPANPPAASFGRLTRATEGTDPKGALAELLSDALSALSANDVRVHPVGTAATLLGLADDDDTAPAEALEPADLLRSVADTMHREPAGLIIATPANPNGGGREAGPVAVARALTRFDAALGVLLDQIPEDTLLVVTSLGGRDATNATRSGASREFAPLLAYTPALPSGVDLGTRATLADVGATVAAVLGAGGVNAGISFLDQLVS